MKRFFTHTGIAAGYYALFFAMQIWASLLFTFSYSMGYGFALGAQYGPNSLAMLNPDQLATSVLSCNDLIMVLMYLALAGNLFALLYAERPGRPLAAARLLRPDSAAMLWAPVVLGAAYFFAVPAAMSLIPEDSALMQQYLEASSMLEVGRWPWLTAVVTVVGAPLLEELLFRGAIYSHLKKAMPVGLALVVQAAAFSVAHGQLLWMLYTFALGLLLGLVADYFDSLWPCVLTHLCFNACNYLPIALSLDETGWLITLLASLLVCAVVLLALALYRRGHPARRPQLS